MKVKKDFDGKAFRGAVISLDIDKDDNTILAHILYKDGDEEDISLTELAEIRLSDARHLEREINEVTKDMLVGTKKIKRGTILKKVVSVMGDRADKSASRKFIAAVNK